MQFEGNFLPQEFIPAVRLKAKFDFPVEFHDLVRGEGDRFSCERELRPLTVILIIESVFIPGKDKATFVIPDHADDFVAQAVRIGEDQD